MNTTPVANRPHIAIFGRRNAGKSSLINLITGQEIALVSDYAGTTTDPVYKTMEILPIGPVMIIDTAGLDDDGALGKLRIEKTYEVLRKTNVAILVVSAEEGITDFEKNFANELNKRDIPLIGVVNKCDVKDITEDDVKEYSNILGIPFEKASALTGEGAEKVKKLIIEHTKTDDTGIGLVGDLIKSGDMVVLVTPIDKAAPKGRLILPQQQTIRDIIESDAMAVVTKEHELKQTLESLAVKPSIVITDSQAFLKVSADTPEDIPLTSFSILFARQKGDLVELTKGLKKIEELKDGDKVLIVEGCTHHRQADDIGKVKIPRWIRQISGVDIEFKWASGAYYPRDMENYDLIIHCGGCMLNKKEMQFRINHARESGVYITNYGMLIAYVQGILKRALKPFPAASLVLEEEKIV
jgi:[FeFe] hydrogenase H-cluster maturation GTPase HydF